MTSQFLYKRRAFITLIGGVAARGTRHFGAAEQNFGAESQVLHKRRSD